MKKDLKNLLPIVVLMVIYAESMVAEDTPKSIRQQGEECLRLMLQGDPTASSYYANNAGVYLDTSFFTKASVFIPMIGDMHRAEGITKRKTMTYIPHNKTRGMEVGYLLNSNNQKKILYATGWSLQDNHWKKDFEFLKPLTQQINPDDHFEVSRKRWVTLCNLHDPAALTSEMYLDKAIYFSYGEVTIGPTSIAERYAYMSRPDYTLDLRAAFTVAFDDVHGMEVGNYINATNEGVYIILWKKMDDSWRIILDFNF